ncbi:MAG: GNAT family N-acetyltransferase [Alphaproteobacteria bacterium]
MTDSPRLPDKFSRLEAKYDLGDLRAGNMEVFIASSNEDIRASQALRYRVFFEEMNAPMTEDAAATKLDRDKFDDVCDHLLVVEHQGEGRYKVVGTYRLLRRSAMEKIGHFYTEGEYNIDKIKAYQGEILEVGRSCVDASYRNRAVMQLLWRGIGAYVARFNVALMFGCASFFGIDPQQHAQALSYLHHFHRAPADLCPVALKERYVEMNMMPKEQVNQKEAFTGLPALIKGYLRLSGYIGNGAVIDPDYNTTDVSIVVKTDRVTEKYAQRYATKSS